MPYHPFQFDNLTVRDENLTGWPRKPEVIRKILSDYYALITHLDEQIGRIIDALKRSGQYENTIIVYAADNGLAVGSHGLLGKQSLYEHRSEEHTSELQSLMRISYAVFCLKKKKQQYQKKQTNR